MKKTIFTESNFREMAIGWTASLEELRQIPGIDVDAVDQHGHLFLPLVQRFSGNYEQMMGSKATNRHEPQNVIDLLSSDDDDEVDEQPIGNTNNDIYGDGDDDDDEEFAVDGETEYAMQEAENGSKYFQPPKMSSSGRAWRGKPKSGRGGAFYRGRGRGRFRKSNGGSTRSSSSAGVTKRKPSGGAEEVTVSKASTRTMAQSSNFFKSFSRSDGRDGGRGGGSGGIGMMPT